MFGLMRFKAHAPVDSLHEEGVVSENEPSDDNGRWGLFAESELGSDDGERDDQTRVAEERQEEEPQGRASSSGGPDVAMPETEEELQACSLSAPSPSERPRVRPTSAPTLEPVVKPVQAGVT